MKTADGGERYAKMRPDDGGGVREELGLELSRPWNELEMQARWFAGEFGGEFRSTAGEAVRVVQFGVWNREAGPDFAEAAVSLNGGAPVRGCIELDRDARDWERHGHSVNENYDAVVLHVFFERGKETVFTRDSKHRNIPQVLLDRSKLERATPAEAPGAKPGRCVAPLREMGREAVGGLLEAAAQFRLRQKAARILRIAEAHGSDEALYQSLAAALGYKSNTLAFTLLAQRLPVRGLLRESRSDALLFGVAGFLAGTSMPRFEPETQSYVREIWEGWWPARNEWERLALAPGHWRLGGMRPANHPQRRVAALGQIVKHWSAVRRLQERFEVQKVYSFFAGLHDEYWDHHFTLGSKKMDSSMALVGESRTTEMLANVFFPLAFHADPAVWSAYRQLPATAASRRAQIAAIRLFGSMPEGLLKTTAQQQGLLQIYDDFCMRDASDCAECLFPKQAAQWR